MNEKPNSQHAAVDFRNPPAPYPPKKVERPAHPAYMDHQPKPIDHRNPPKPYPPSDAKAVEGTPGKVITPPKPANN